MDIRTQTERFYYGEKYKREEFAEKSSVLTFDHHDAINFSHEGKPVLEDAVHMKRRPKIPWLQEYNLGSSSHPIEWLDAIFARKQHSYERKKNKKKERVSIFSDWKNFTNLKASLYHAGHKIYKGWKEFKTDEARQYVGLYILDRVSPSPRVDTKF